MAKTKAKQKEKTKKKETPNVTDYRKKQIFKIRVTRTADVEKEWHNYMIPEGVKNKIYPIKTRVEGEKELVDVGDFEIGDDGFIEIMFAVDGHFIKLKKYPDEEFVSVISY